MSAGSSNFQRALCKVLTAHIGKVVFKLVCPRKDEQGVKLHRCNGGASVEVGKQCSNIRDRIDGKSFDDGGFLCVFFRHKKGRDAVSFCPQRHREHAVDRTDLSGKAQFPHKGGILRQGGKLIGGGKHRKKDGKVKCRTKFSLACRGKIYCDSARRKLIAAKSDGGLHPQTGFLDGSIGQSDNVKSRHSTPEGRLHCDRKSVNSVDTITFQTAVHKTVLPHKKLILL